MIVTANETTHNNMAKWEMQRLEEDSKVSKEQNKQLGTGAEQQPVWLLMRDKVVVILENFHQRQRYIYLNSN